ncbi:hypothetical protein [Kibdelosporangium philippinense]
MYHYFGSKDDLLHEIYGRVLREQTDRLEISRQARRQRPSGSVVQRPTS